MQWKSGRNSSGETSDTQCWFFFRGSRSRSRRSRSGEMQKVWNGQFQMQTPATSSWALLLDHTIPPTTGLLKNACDPPLSCSRALSFSLGRQPSNPSMEADTLLLPSEESKWAKLTSSAQSSFQVPLSPSCTSRMQLVTCQNLQLERLEAAGCKMSDNSTT